MVLTRILPCLVLVACGDDDAPPARDGGTDAGTIDTDAGADAGTDAGVEPLPVDPAFDDSYTEVGRDRVVTTLVETLRPRYGFELYAERGYSRVPLDEFGRLHGQPGEAHMLRNQLALPAGVTIDWTAGDLPGSSRSLFYGFVLADLQYVDQESPVVAPNNNVIGETAYRPHGDLAPHLGDAVVRALAEFNAMREVDMVFALGDCVENAQSNELEWFMTTLNGGELTFDSGDRDDVVPGPNNDATDTFVSAGVPDGVPWISVIGNHDVLANGNFPPGLLDELNSNDAVRMRLSGTLAALGLALPGISTSDRHPAYLAPADRAAFTVNRDAFALSQLPYLPTSFALLGPATIPADPDRVHLTPCEWIERHVDNPHTGTPAGHGFTAEMVANCNAMRAIVTNGAVGGWYALDLVPGAIRALGLALGPVEGGSRGILSRPPPTCMIGGMPCRGDPRYDQVAFLEAELARAETDGVAIIVMSHQPSVDIVTTPAIERFRPLFEADAEVTEIVSRYIPAAPPEAVSGEDFRRILAANEHVIAHIAGHTHANIIRAICADGTERMADGGACDAGPEGQTGYWELTTSGIIDFPHQGRFFEIVHVAANTGAFYLTMLDPRIPEDSLTELGRFISRADIAARLGHAGGLGEATDRNVVLPFVVPDDVAANWMTAMGEDDLASETVLTMEAGSIGTHPVWP